jgi:peptidoglycan-N-acetylglucosamine deacetylase
VRWPGGAPCAVSITVDVDGEHGLPDGGAGWEHRLTARSERRYGIARGLPRVLAVLATAGVRGTFYVPGAVAAEDPDAVAAIVAGGHEIGHHGHRHVRLDEMGSVREQLADLEAGIEALEAAVGYRPLGYRAPGWELTPETLHALAEHGFQFDSSLMHSDDVCRIASGERELWELPVHWTLDDAPHFASGGDADALLRIWRAELGVARGEGRHVTYTLHPEILGRPHRIGVLEALVEDAAAAGAWVAAHGAVVAHLAAP